MKLLRLVFVLVLVLTGCNHTGTTKQQFKDKTTYNVSDVSNKTNNGEAVGKEYGGKGTGYGQVKKIPPGNAVPPIAVAPPNPEIPHTIEGVVISLDKVLTEKGYKHGLVSIGYNSGVQLITVEGDFIEMNEEISYAVYDLTGFYLDNVGYNNGKNYYLPLDFNS